MANNVRNTKTVSANVNTTELKIIDKLVELGVYNSRSAVFRECIEKSLPYLIDKLDNIYKILTHPIIDVNKFLNEQGYMLVPIEKHKNRCPKKYRIPLGNTYWKKFIDDNGKVQGVLID